MKLAPSWMQEVIQALQALRGVAKMTAATLVSEVGELSRFETPRQLMGYSGTVPSEDSSGERMRRGSHHQNRQRPSASSGDRGSLVLSSSPRHRSRTVQRQKGVSEEVKEIAWKAQHRLHKHYQRHGGRQRSEKNHHRRGTRAVGLHLGDRYQDGGTFWSAAGDDRVSPRTKIKSQKTFC